MPKTEIVYHLFTIFEKNKTRSAPHKRKIPCCKVCIGLKKKKQKTACKVRGVVVK